MKSVFSRYAYQSLRLSVATLFAPLFPKVDKVDKVENDINILSVISNTT